MDYDQFIFTVSKRANVSFDQAKKLSHATLQTLADRLSGGEALDLCEQLPESLHDALRRPRDEQAERFGIDEFLQRVTQRAGLDGVGVDATDGARAVLSTVRESVTQREFDDVMTQLPNEFRRVTQPARG